MLVAVPMEVALSPKPRDWDPFVIKPRLFLTLIGIFLIVATQGCGPRDEIRRYRVPKRRAVNDSNVHRTRMRFKEMGKAEAGDDAIYGAMVPVGNHLWVVEFAGPADRLAVHADDFLDFVQSLQITKRPPWELPDGWDMVSRRGAIAAFRVGGASEHLEVTVSQFEIPSDIPTSWMLMRALNSWRRQFSLPLILPNELPDHTVCFHLDDAQVLAANLAGTRVAEEGPAAGMPPGHPPIATGGGETPGDDPTAEGADTPPSERFRYTVPDGWQPGQRVVSRGGITVTREAAFLVADGDAKLEITVTVLPPFGASLARNVNRWRGQVGLEPLEPAELEASVEKVAVGDLTGQFVELVGPEGDAGSTTVFGAIATQGNHAWVFTLKGNGDLAKREREKFLAFLKSIEFKGEDGADDGD